jgi:3-isopropylmalate/(R)-2-methylmalate dehydratase small subunit
MSIKGKVWRFGDDVNTDEIIPARFLSSTDPTELAQNAMVGVDPDFPSKVKTGDIIVADKNFGCGSSREHAPVAIKGAGVSCVIAKSFARIFYRNAFNMGLLIFESEEAPDNIKEGDIIEVDPDAGTITNTTTGTTFQTAPVPEFMQELVKNDGLIPHIKKKLATNA